MHEEFQPPAVIRDHRCRGGSVFDAGSPGRPKPSVPSQIEVPAGNKVFLIGHGVGVQIYSCNATTSGTA